MALGTNNLTSYEAKHIMDLGKSTSWIYGRDVARVNIISYTGYDAIWSMKTTSGDWSLGVYTDNILYWTYTPDSLYNSHTNSEYTLMFLDSNGNLAASKGNLGTSSYPWNNIYIGKADGAGIYYVGSKDTYRMIRFIDNTEDIYGNGISIGGGGYTVIGSGESADTMVANRGYTGGSEVMIVASDGDIQFFPGNNSYDASAQLTMSASRLWAGVNGNTAREALVGVQSGAGQLYMWSHASTTGDRGIYAPAHGSGGARSIFSVNTNNRIFFADSYNGTATALAYSLSGLAASAITWLTCWNGYELRAISKAEVRNAVISAGMYWANVAVSASSSTGTSPTFSTAYTSNWWRSTGSTGWYSESHGGGWYMTDNTWIRSYGSKPVYVNARILTPIVTINGDSTSYNLYVNGTGRFNNTVYFANGTSFYVNSSGLGRFCHVEAKASSGETHIRAESNGNSGTIYLYSQGGNGGVGVYASRHGNLINYDYNGNLNIGSSSAGARILLEWKNSGSIALITYNNYKFYLLADGNLVLYNSNNTVRWQSGTNSSTYLVKDNIRPLRLNEVERFKKLRPVSFTYKPEMKYADTSMLYGLIVEELINIYPELVTIPENYDAKKFNLSKGIHLPLPGIKYELFIPILINIVLIQQQEIEKLKLVCNI